MIDRQGWKPVVVPVNILPRKHLWTTSPRVCLSSTHFPDSSKCSLLELHLCWSHEVRQMFCLLPRTLETSIDLLLLLFPTTFLIYFIRNYSNWRMFETTSRFIHVLGAVGLVFEVWSLHDLIKICEVFINHDRVHHPSPGWTEFLWLANCKLRMSFSQSSPPIFWSGVQQWHTSKIHPKPSIITIPSIYFFYSLSISIFY